MTTPSRDIPAPVARSWEPHHARDATTVGDARLPPTRRRGVAQLDRGAQHRGDGRMATDLQWFDELSAEDRSWVGLIVQGGIKGFVDWYGADTARPGQDEPRPTPRSTTVVFGAAPRELTGVIDLKQTVDLVRLSIWVVETNIDALLHPEDDARGAPGGAALRPRGRLRHRAVYARAAEARGAWDARLEALVVDAVVRAEADEAVLSRASALGWGAHGDVAVVLGAMPPHRAEIDVFEPVRRAARAGDMDALCATQGDRLVVLLGGVTDPLRRRRGCSTTSATDRWWSGR